MRISDCSSDVCSSDLPYVDRVVYLVDGRFRIGTPAQVMTSETLSELYQTRVEVLQVQGRLLVVGADESACHGNHGRSEARRVGKEGDSKCRTRWSSYH